MDESLSACIEPIKRKALFGEKMRVKIQIIKSHSSDDGANLLVSSI